MAYCQRHIAYSLVIIIWFYPCLSIAYETICITAMLLDRPCWSCYEVLPVSVDAEYGNWFRGQSLYVGFLSWCIIFTECSLPWQHFRWRHKQTNIDITVKFVLITLLHNPLANRNISKVEYECIHVADWRQNFVPTTTYLNHFQNNISYSSRRLVARELSFSSGFLNVQRLVPTGETVMKQWWNSDETVMKQVESAWNRMDQSDETVMKYVESRWICNETICFMVVKHR